MREINYEDYPEEQRFTINRMERLDQLRDLDTSVPYSWKRVTETRGNEGEVVATSTAEYTLADTTLLGKLKAHALFSYRQDLKMFKQEDLADFILNPPRNGGVL